MAWKAGYGEAYITPELGCELCGYGFYLDRRAETVLDDLMVRVVHLETDTEAGLLMSCDLIGLSPQQTQQLREAVADILDIPPSHVLLACTHTHSSPFTLSLAGMGEELPGYAELLRQRVLEAAQMAHDDSQLATLAHGHTHCEPIGYNRTTASFDPLDPDLGVAVFRRPDRNILLLNYACHPVTLFRSTEVSSDWCGALCREIATAGHHALVFQGFCGDVDPVTRWNGVEGWGYPEDVALYGKLLARRAMNAEGRLREDDNEYLGVAAQALDMPLQIPADDAAIIEESEKWIAMFAQAGPRFDVVPNAERFIREWRDRALNARLSASKNPFLRNVPFAAWRLGGLRLLGVPAETFTSIGLHLKSEFPGLMRLGYANGDIGYLPDAAAFDNPFDYAAYLAPKVCAVFPFETSVTHIAIQHCRDLLNALK